MKKGLMLAALFAGCALLSKGELGARRFYSLDDGSMAEPAKTAASNVELRLGRVSARACGSELMMVRASAVEVFFDDERRWAERPEVSFRRALERSLFELHGLRSRVRGAGPVLDVELLELEEVRGPAQVGRVTVAWVLHDERVVLHRQTLRVDRPIEAKTGEAVAVALGAAMHQVVESVAAQVSAALIAKP